MWSSIRLATAFVLFSSAPSLAQAIYLETTCATSVRDGSQTYCDQGVTFDLVSGGTSDVIQLRLTAPATHCSPVSYLVAFPPPPPPGPDDIAIAVPSTPLSPVIYGHNSLAMSGVLGPGESEMVAFFDERRRFERGTHRLMVMVIGHVADCNVGQIQSWGVTVEQMLVPQ
jgi:hypothetical protein